MHRHCEKTFCALQLLAACVVLHHNPSLFGIFVFPSPTLQIEEARRCSSSLSRQFGTLFATECALPSYQITKVLQGTPACMPLHDVQYFICSDGSKLPYVWQIECICKFKFEMADSCDGSVLHWQCCRTTLVTKSFFL
ncbi:hypothetical protein COO60DRAFT_1627443, partial [Scenedesmus sp. NREL 46B-D3]